MAIDISFEFNTIRHKLNEIGEYLEEEQIQLKAQQIEKKMSSPDFWNNTQNERELQDYKKYKSLLEEYDNLKKECQQIVELQELIVPDDNEYADLEKEIHGLFGRIEDLDIRLLFRNQEDQSNAIITIHSGAGGTESQDWVQILFRMYSRFCERKKFDVKVTDVLEGEEAGLKHITFLAQGQYAYGYLKSESGVHRLVRISPFDANRRRHTTFALVDVIPEVSEEINIDIKPQDLRIETFRASGRGGQHVNTTDSAVRVVHLPSGLIVQCQNERSQYQNKAVAMRILRARLYKLAKKEQEERTLEMKGDQKEIAWGNQIRSYVFQPYSMIKDHRTNYEIGNVQRVMDGEIDDFIDAYLRKDWQGRV
ncbi:MAG: peptide chain release factor 2 [Candidatus Atribacteria bacterium]|nr:peptide chain release factor 2 [Candidatus Atribacteria bacterium]